MIGYSSEKTLLWQSQETTWRAMNLPFIIVLTNIWSVGHVMTCLPLIKITFQGFGHDSPCKAFMESPLRNTPIAYKDLALHWESLIKCLRNTKLCSLLLMSMTVRPWMYLSQSTDMMIILIFIYSFYKNVNWPNYNIHVWHKGGKVKKYVIVIVDK